MSAPKGCEAVEGWFVWGAQLCLRESVATVEAEGEERAVCAEHLAIFNKRGAA